MSETQKTYECVCGRILYTPNSFNAHKRHCKEHLISVNKYESYLASQNNFKKAGAENSKRVHDKAQEASKDSLIKWISEEHKCEKCGIIMTEKFGSGRFCSRKCSNSRIKSEKSKQKVSETLLAKHLNRKEVHDYNKECPHCAFKLDYNDRNRKICPNCEHYLDGRRKKFMHKGVVPLEKTKARELDVEYNGPELPAYMLQLREKGFFKRTELSYAEQFWKRVLDSNKINYEHNFKVNKANNGAYYLDFLIDGYFDLEIDGSQHQFSVLKDMNRTLYLESLGYKCFRLAWVNPNNDTNKMIVNCQIDQLFKLLNKPRLV